MKVMIFAPAGTTERLRTIFESLGHEVLETTEGVSDLLEIVRKSQAELLLLDPNLAFQSALQAAHEGRVHGKVVAFLSPSDDIVREVLLDLDPVGILARPFNATDIASLVAAVAAERAETGRKKHASPPSDPAGGAKLQFIAVASMLAAIAVGFFLPNGLTVLEAIGYTAYIGVVLLALVSVGCLLRAQRPMQASLYATAIALVTVLPTQQ